MNGDAVTDTSPRTITLALPTAASGPRSYDIVIGEGIISQLGQRASQLVSSRHAMLIVDDQLPGDFVRKALESLDSAGFDITQARVRALETNKTLATVERLLIEIDRANLERGDLIIALGGGIVGDVAGFVAASYRRGVAVIQCPTTLLAMVDASVGGKTGVNLQVDDHDLGASPTLRKNMVGAFWQPSLVLADIASLLSLPDRELRAGLGECFKHGLLSGNCDPDLWTWTSDHLLGIIGRHADQISELVERNVRVKAHIVEQDERELASSAKGGRALLNLGHTFAHAIETIPTLTPDGDPTHAPLLHGEAVALGLVAASEVAVALGRIDQGEADRVRAAIERLGVRSRIKGLPSNEQTLEAMGHDKKVKNGKLRLVIPIGAARCEVIDNPPVNAVFAGISAIRPQD